MFNRKNGSASQQEAVKEIPACNTKIGKGIVMVGDFEINEPIEVNGTIEGRVFSSSVVNVSEQGLIKGQAKVENINVQGTLDGHFTCNNVARFSETGVMKGSLTTNQFETKPGTTFFGTLNLSAQRIE